MLAEVARFRVLSGEHVRHLVFPNVSVRMANRRLGLLATHGLLARHVLPDVEGPFVVRSRRPLYSLTRLGAEQVGDGLWPSVRFVPSAWAVTRHNLIAVDLLVAVTAAARGQGVSVAMLPEGELRRRLRASRQVGNRFPAGVLPDGAFSLTGADGRTSSFCIEVVRAGAKGGNKSFAEKMKRYVALNHAGFFESVYGLKRVRAVLILTTSSDRAVRLVALASALPHGRQLFWATGYERRTSFGMSFSPGSVLAPMFVDCTGQHHCLHSPTTMHV